MIEGFDPDRFRKANKGGGGGGGGGLGHPDGPASFHHRGSQNNNARNLAYGSSSQHSAALERSQEVDIPGVIPTYDRSEQQIIAALEQELGI